MCEGGAHVVLQDRSGCISASGVLLGVWQWWVCMYPLSGLSVYTPYPGPHLGPS